jgi:uncharacterized protein (TIGR02001 family)
MASQYIYRGIAQTKGNPAIQGGFDYDAGNGIYVGTWGSNISWLSDQAPGGTASGASASMELDVYGGYKGSINSDLGYDVGILTYNYPGDNLSGGNAKPDTVELYGALSYKWLTAKYSVTTGSLFGWTKPDGGKTSGSGYLDLSASYDMGNGLSLGGHVGHQTVSGFSDASYTDYNVSVSKDIAKVGTIALLVSGTNAKDDCATGEAYCFAGDYSAGKNTAVLSFSKSF